MVFYLGFSWYPPFLVCILIKQFIAFNSALLSLKKTIKNYSTKKILNWYQSRGWKPFPFQSEIWDLFQNGYSGLLNAPTGSGKTYALWLACLIQQFNQPINQKGIKVIWVTPLRALSVDLAKALQLAVDELQIGWEVAVRTGDTSTEDRAKQLKSLPDCLITTPESLHILFANKNHGRIFQGVRAVIVDEWHELMSTKRGVQMELGLARIKSLSSHKVLTWGISATIGNLDEAMDVLVTGNGERKKLVKAQISKRIQIESIVPDDIQEFPWGGHVGIRLADKVLPIIEQSTSTLLFTNTRSQAEIWYREILRVAPQFAGVMAMHHGSIDRALRTWVEEALKEGKLKLVVCTSSLDLGVDFSPVESVIQVGGPKGVSRFFQRAGRSGHQPGSLSRIYFVPTNALELIEGAALKLAQNNEIHEERPALTGSLDVLVQYLVTLAVGGGFDKEEVFRHVKNTYAYKNLTKEEFNWAIRFVSTGGESLSEYAEFTKVVFEEGLFKVNNRTIAQKHRLSIGTIVGDPILHVRFITGGFLGTIEESFISSLKPGDTFWFSGQCLEFIRVKDMTAYVRKSNRKGGVVPQWQGGRLPLSSKLSELIRMKLEEARVNVFNGIEMEVLEPMLKIQQKNSIIPSKDELLIENVLSDEGHHIFIYPFEGRFVHEVLSAIIAYRISRLKPLTFSIAANDYGFELLSDQEIPIVEALEEDLFSMENLMEDIDHSINEGELAKRKFRDIATISGLVFHGYPGKKITNKHLQASSSVIYDVFVQYDKDNLLVRQAKEEVVTLQLDLNRLIQSLRKINQQKIVLIDTDRATPFSFPIMAERLRERFTNEKLIDRLMRIQSQIRN